MVRDNPEKMEQLIAETEGMGVTILSQYALFGPYDFMTVLKADSHEVVMRVAIEATAGGKMEVLTLPAIHIDKYVESMKK